MTSGSYRFAQGGPMDCIQSDYSEHYESSAQVTVPLSYPPGTMVSFTFYGVDYGHPPSNGSDLSQVTFQGQPPYDVNYQSGVASFLGTVSGGDSLTISSDTFQGPGAATWNPTSFGGCLDPCPMTVQANWTKAGGVPIITPVTMGIVHVDPSNFVACVGDTVPFHASGAPSGSYHSRGHISAFWIPLETSRLWTDDLYLINRGLTRDRKVVDAALQRGGG